MMRDLRTSFTRFCLLFSLFSWSQWCPAQIRDGGIDPWNLGKGDWIYYMSMATNRLGGNVPSVTNENSLMLFYKSQGVRYIMVKAATSDQLFNGSYSFPQFTSNLCHVARSHGIWIFGYNRSYGSNVLGEVAISDFVFQQGADGFVFDAEGEWESSRSWILDQGPAKAWQLCSMVRSNWPTKFLAHAPFPIISYHNSFPYKEFGYWCDAVMPQIYPAGWTGVKSRPSGGIDWTDVNWRNWQNSLINSNSIVDGRRIYWTNAIKPLAPANHAYGPNPPNAGVSEIPAEFVMEFIDYLVADPHAQTPGGYRGANFWRADLHGAGQWSYLKPSTIGSVTGVVNNIVIDDPTTVTVGSWTATRTFYNGSFYGGGSGTDTNSFGTNYTTKARGNGSAYVQFTPKIIVPGDYNVYQWHPFLTNASASAPFEIKHNLGATTVYANQKTNAGRWSLLGKFNFAGGTNSYVRVLDNVAETSAVAIADGIKLVYALPTSAPAIPSGLQATGVSPWEVQLQWKDNSTDESGFVISRSVTSGGPYTNVATVSANSTNYLDSGLTPDTFYYYVIRSQNVAGNSPNTSQVQTRTLPFVPEPPAIITDPDPATVLPGEAAVFSVEASGTPLLSYQWYLNGTPVAGATASACIIPSTAAIHAGSYSVTVTNLYGTATSASADLTLTPLGAWGDNQFQQTRIPPTVSNMVAVAAGSWHNLALSADGQVAAWGNNTAGQCNVPMGLSNVLAIAAGGYHSLAIRADCTVAAWGSNDQGQCDIPAGLNNVIGVAAGGLHSVALRADGTVTVWGSNTLGQLAVPNGLSNVVAIAAGTRHNLALKSDGLVVAWGSNLDPDGAYAGQAAVPVGLNNVIAIAAGEAHSLALKADGTVVAWGDNSEGQCTMPPGLGQVAGIAAGGSHSLALRTDGTVRGWGADWNGQCTVPSALTNAIGIGAGMRHSIGLVTGARPQAKLLHPSIQSGRFSAVAQTLLRKQYRLEYTDSLNSTNWQALPTWRGNGALRLLSDPQAPPTSRYYRLEQW